MLLSIFVVLFLVLHFSVNTVGLKLIIRPKRYNSGETAAALCQRCDASRCLQAASFTRSLHLGEYVYNKNSKKKKDRQKLNLFKCDAAVFVLGLSCAYVHTFNEYN